MFDTQMGCKLDAVHVCWTILFDEHGNDLEGLVIEDN